MTNKRFTDKAVFSLVRGFIKKSRKSFKFPTIAIVIGVWGLIVITSVVNGFDRLLIDSITRFYPHITVAGKSDLYFSGVKEKMFFNLDNSMVAFNGSFEYVQLMDCDDMSFLGSSIISGQPENGAAIGKELSEYLNVSLGDELTVFKIKGIIPIAKKYKVVSLFKTGVYIFDSKFLVINDKDSVKNFTAYYFEDPLKADEYKNKYFSYSPAYTWKESNKTLTQTVEIDGLIALLITVFIVLMAGFSVSNSITFSILTRKKEIGILKSLGMKNIDIQKVFISESLIISVIGYLLGLAGGMLTVTMLDFFKIKIPSGIFYVDYLPVSLNLSIAGSSFFIITGIVVFFSFLTTRMISGIDTLEALKDE